MFGFITLIEVVVAISLLVYIYAKKTGENVLGSATIIPMSRENLSFPGSNTYAYFFELPEGAVATESAAWLPYTVTRQYNLDGLNDLSNYDVTKPLKTFRIMTMGDSFTFGLWVPTPENYSEKLEIMLNTNLMCPGVDHIEVLNMGVPGYDVAYTVERYTRKGAKYTPDLLLWYIQDDDFFILNEEFYARIALLKKEMEISVSAERSDGSVDSMSRVFDAAYEEVYKKNEGFNTTSRKEYTKPEREALRNFLSNNLLPVTIFTFADTPDEYKSYIQEGMRGLSNVSYFDAIEDVETFHPYDYHPTSKGHTIIAESLFQYLTTTNTLLSRCVTK